MKLLHQGFDKIDLTLQGAAPQSFIAKLAEAKAQAIQEQAPAIIKIGTEERFIRVKENGSKGGYSYSFDIGEESIIFAVKDSDKREGWNIRAFISSLKLATEGHEQCFEELFDWLRYLGVIGTQGKAGELAISLSRVDYCFDFLLPKKFQPNPNAFVFHSNAKKGVEYNVGVEGNSKSDHSIRIGKMPNKQVAVYNKTIEIQQKHKEYWFKIWDISEDIDQSVWRFELRSGKEHLKKHNVTTLGEFREGIQLVMLEIHSTIRYVTLRKRGNRARFPNVTLWDEVGELLPNITKAHSPNVTYNEILPYQREDKKEILYKQLLGGSLNLGIQEGYDAKTMNAFFEKLTQRFLETMKDQPEKYTDKFERLELKSMLT